jgi:transposase-like protein
VERHIGGVSETKPKYWSKLIAEQEAGGQKVRSFCRERGITEPSFYYWRKRLRQRETVRFALLATKPADTDSQASALELVLRNGERLRIGNQVDAARLRIVLEAVRG